MKSKKKVGIIDYGAGNLGSIFNAIQYLDSKVEILVSPLNLKKYSHLILPGVGSFGRLANNLKKKDWPGEINSFVKNGKSLLGVCVGMQLLFEQSEESNKTSGLNLIKGKFNIFKKSGDYPLPHVGFNEVVHKNTPIWKGIKKILLFILSILIK